MNDPHETSPASGIRKAAILIASLDPAAADVLLDQLGPEQAEHVRQATIDLGQIDPREQRRVIDEFRRIRPMIPEQQPAGIELDDRLARTLAASGGEPALRRADGPHATGVPKEPPSFAFLRDAEAEKLAGVLGDERPQTIALVLSHLPPDRAASLLGRLPAALQVEVIHRLVDFEETDPEILREVEQALQSRLAEHLDGHRRRTAGIEAVADILNASASPWRTQILDNLAAHDRTLAARLCPQRVEFDDLPDMDDATLDAVLRAVAPELMMTALVGAAPRLIDRVVDRLPPREAADVRRQLDHPGPIRLSDVEDARRRVAQQTQHLAGQGAVALAKSPWNVVT